MCSQQRLHRFQGRRARPRQGVCDAERREADHTRNHRRTRACSRGQVTGRVLASLSASMDMFCRPVVWDPATGAHQHQLICPAQLRPMMSHRTQVGNMSSFGKSILLYQVLKTLGCLATSRDKKRRLSAPDAEVQLVAPAMNAYPIL